jgi:hypothetical protein
MKAEITSLLRELNQRPIAFHPIYKELTGCFEGALLLSQILYWEAVMGNEFYKTDDDFKKELMMSDREFRRGKAAIKSAPFIKTVVRGVPARTFYSVNYDAYAVAMKAAVSKLHEKRTNQFVHPPYELVCTPSYELVCTPSYELDCTPAVRTITENTAETTPEINTPPTPQGGKSEAGSNSYAKKTETVQELLAQLSEMRREIFETWLAYKAEKRQGYKPTGLKTLIKQFAELPNGELRKWVEHSMSMNYAGIYKPKEDVAPAKPKWDGGIG